MYMVHRDRAVYGINDSCSVHGYDTDLYVIHI